MKYTSDYFYSSWKGNENLPSYQITDDIIEKIKSLKSRISNESGYYDTMLQWTTDDNAHLKTGAKSLNDELNDIYPAIQFITMTAEIKPEFIEKYKVEKYHIALLRRLYLDTDFDDSSSYVTMGFKRPFGNSNVMGDVREEMLNAGDVGAINRYNHDESDFAEEAIVLSEFVNILDKFLQEGAFNLIVWAFDKLPFEGKYTDRDRNKPWRNLNLPYFHSYLYDWTPNISVARNEKIEKILN